MMMIDAPEAVDATWEEMAGLMDLDCESSNRHELCGLHYDMGKMWEKEFGSDIGMDMAHRLMKLLLERGGLDTMSFENH